MDLPIDGPVLFFDGLCNLCSAVVRFVIRHDPKKKFFFASLQSGPGKKAILQVRTSKGLSPDSFILLYNGKYHTKSSAVLLTAKLMGGVWYLAYAAIIIPRFIRDGVYDLVARGRYKWFGKSEKCMVPGPGINSRFLS